MVASSKLPEGVTSYVDRHGKRRYRYRAKGGYQKSLPAPDQPGFKAAYASALLESSEKQVTYTKKSLRWLIAQYQIHDKGWNALGPKTRKDKSALIKRMDKAWGLYDFTTLTTTHLVQIMDDIPAKSVYNRILGIWRALLGFAQERGWVTDNVAMSVKRLNWKVQKTHGWTKAEIAKYREYHASGSKARLAFELMFCTVQGSADAVYMGPRMIHKGCIDSSRVKTDAAYCAPITAELQTEIDLLPAQFLFLLTHEGKPYSERGFHQRMSAWIEQAGLPDRCTPHGIRVAGCEELAESGATAPQLMAISGHITLSEAQGYIQKAKKRTMALMASEKRNMANRDE